MTGAQALAFVRQRHELPNGDLDRIVRQQVFLGAMASKVLSADMLTSPSKVRELVSAVQRSVILSDGWELSTFASQMSGPDRGRHRLLHDPHARRREDRRRGRAAGRSRHQVAAFVASLATGRVRTSTSSDSPRPSEDGDRDHHDHHDRRRRVATGPRSGLITVDVRNGSNTKGLAATVRQTLAGKGFQGGDDRGRAGAVVVGDPARAR